MCFVWIWEQTAIISLYSINWLVCITETKCVYCAVRTRSLYIIQVMCFVWIWEQTAIISLYNINWLVFITGTECVYCAVRIEYWNIIQMLKEALLLILLLTIINLYKQHNTLTLGLYWEKFRMERSREYYWLILFPQSLQNFGLRWRIASVLKALTEVNDPLDCWFILTSSPPIQTPHGMFRKPDLFPSSNGGMEWHLPKCVRSAYHSNCAAYSTSIVFVRSCP